MIYLVLSLFCLLNNKGHNSITKVLFGLLLFTTIGAYMVGYQPQMELDVQIYTLYMAVLYTVMFLSFNKYSDLISYDFSQIDNKRLEKVEKVSILLGIFVIFIYVYVLSNVLHLLVLEEISVQSHKNEGGSAETFDNLVPHIFITLGNLISPLGYLFLSFHFFYLIKCNIKKSILFLFLSLCLIMSGLIALSRASTANYILCYVTILFFIFPLLNKKIKRGYFFFSTLIGTLIFSVLLFISGNRFSDGVEKTSSNTSIISEKEQPLLFSLFDYFSQWEENGPIILKKFNCGDESWGLYNSSGLGVQIEKVIMGAEKVSQQREKKYDKLLGEQSSRFHGFIGRLVYDFGFIGTILFVLILKRIVINFSPSNHVLNMKTLLALPVILPIFVLFWVGNALSDLVQNLAIIYNIIVWRFLRKGRKYLSIPK